MNEIEKCVACGKEMLEGACIGRLCYYCIKETVVNFKTSQKEDIERDIEFEIAHYTSLLKNSDLAKLEKRKLIKDFILTLKDLN